MAQGALPDFAISIPSSSPSAPIIMGVWREVARRYAFVEYDGPPLEPLELYTKKSGDEIVGQLYNFTDKGGREVALRPEMTPTLARMVAAQGERAAQAGALVLDAAALSLRAPAARTAARALPAERRHHRRGRRHRRRGAARGRDRRSCAACGLTSSDVRARVSDRRLLQRDSRSARRRRRAVAGRVRRRSTRSTRSRATSRARSSRAPA